VPPTALVLPALAALALWRAARAGPVPGVGGAGRRAAWPPGRRGWRPARLEVAALALAAAAGLGFLAGQVPRFPAAPAPLAAQAGGLAVFWLSAAALLLAARQLREPPWLARLTWTFLGLGALYVAGRLLAGGVHGPLPDRFLAGRVPGSLFWTWLVALAAAQAAFNRALGGPARLALGALAAATLGVGLAQEPEWLSGWLPPLVALGVVGLAAAPRATVLAGLAGGALAWVTAPAWAPVAARVVADNAQSLFTRREAWAAVLDVAGASPLFGLGPANYHVYVALRPILGWAVRFNSHSQYVDLVAQAGLLGLAAFLWVAVEAGLLAAGLARGGPAGFGRAYGWGGLAGLAGTLAACALGDWALPFVYNVGLAGLASSTLAWLFLGGLAALAGPGPVRARAGGAGHEAGGREEDEDRVGRDAVAGERPGQEVDQAVLRHDQDQQGGHGAAGRVEGQAAGRQAAQAPGGQRQEEPGREEARQVGQRPRGR
jgi:hypothetical protein